MGGRSFEILYAPEVLGHLDCIDRKYWNLIREKVEGQLRHDPARETRNRKPLRKPPIANRWEIRFGPDNALRVFYDLDEANRQVRMVESRAPTSVLAHGKKQSANEVRTLLAFCSAFGAKSAQNGGTSCAAEAVWYLAHGLFAVGWKDNERLFVGGKEIL